MKQPTFNPGDKVTYTSKWLKQIQAPYEMYGMQAEVIETKIIAKRPFVKVRWSLDIYPDGEIRTVCPEYLRKVDSLELID